ncbi:putative L-ascorbate oxidase [Rosa chinensis]|uniref:Putative L-ascorbate oxidase n=1 Tax=Rosa chinensis TaxID=74649 RepID=A0A2P6Q2K9_ROSCH|nr:L-ascorbate oxidase homolog [Rosa chinensis]PRQ28406.1 putative L-ascorbate oxidase [Rosa chinensis]
MREGKNYCFCIALVLVLVHGANGEDPYKLITWKITYGDIYPLGVKQQGILINDQFPGPQIDAVTNMNLVISVFNYLSEPFLISWDGIQQRRNSWQDGMYGTNCPILPGKNFTYNIQVKDQIGSFFYFPSFLFHKAAGGFGGIRIWSRPKIPVPFPNPAGDHTVLAGDWFKTNHYILRRYFLERGRNLPLPDGLLINGRGWNGYTFTVEPGKTYRFRISNVGLTTSLNFRIQGHKMKLVEVEGSHTLQNTYDALDIHLGQSYSVLVTADQPAQDYYVVVSSRFTTKILTTTAILHYSNSRKGVSGPIPWGPTNEVAWSLNQARSIRWNLTASGPRPNPQGSYHYGMIKPARTIMLANSAPYINGKQRYAVNGVSYVPPDTPLKLADYFNIPGVFNLGSIPTNPPGGNGGYLQTSVMHANFREFVEIVFQNWEDSVQSWHIDGYSFFVLGMDGGQWTQASRARYNLRDTVARSTVQVYPKSWTAISVALDNVGMWNVRSQNWARQYLGQQFYLRVYSPAHSWRDELPIPRNAILCGRARGRHTRPL